MNIGIRLINDYWVWPAIHQVGAELVVRVHIAVSTVDELVGSDLSVDVIAGDFRLDLMAVPSDTSPLSAAQIRAITAFADYVFDNSEERQPTQLTVTLRGVSETFLVDA